MRYLFAALAVFFAISISAAQAIYPFNNDQQQQQFTRLTQQLRCLVCQNENLADSDATLAADLRQKVYAQVLQGQTDQQIIQYMVQRYGDFVLFKPPFQANTWILWCAPAALLLLGFWVLFRRVKK